MERKSPDAALVPTLQLASYVVLATGAIFMASRAGSLPASRWEPMGAGTFPQLIFSSIAVLCVAAFIMELAKRGIPRTTLHSAWRRLVALKSVLVNLGLFIAYMISMPFAGFILGTFCYLLLAQLFLAPRRPVTLLIVVGVALLFSIGPYYLFADVFSIYLPRAKW
ncbi:tripartite tricarboxylate transporter TctB family protein [Vreelandella songnenensis]|uniref:Tripartite tricarboxylate transporter TctB family protein n=1 Tax=Vreelandella songnenensis TaxID=1176243 RepID=A0A2T0V811_9GAMM|nr:tripartite tricarboxylate transporter TctB family protein [Halomonas songnenensis]PRY66316.1 tripartite tricarboxylate transporter TctB family protein [Halomonas songnenensis]